MKKYEVENTAFIPTSVKTNFIKQISEEKKIIEDSITTINNNNNNNNNNNSESSSLFSAAPGPKIRKLIVQPPQIQSDKAVVNVKKDNEENKKNSDVPDDLDAFMKEIEELSNKQ